MAFLIIGLLMLAMKFAEIGPVANWGWVWVLLPFRAGRGLVGLHRRSRHHAEA